MSKRHNRKRTRSRPRNRDPGHNRSLHLQTPSIDNYHLTSVVPATPAPFPSMNLGAPEVAWKQINHLQNQQRILQFQQKRDRDMETQRLRFFGGYIDDEVSLFEPMLKVVTDLFDGNTDYEDP
ncbi:hypothetical protein BU24DRAFT_50547 [Aaosphaeria arxii CBS 175.79]|uniref:Uncharacterized protein n=1 Tax=Aaosphaeria arxii CBS 175.79 TaxID=1450172 RepID=A0A6A5XDB0_9PLEO|nr:uncharacterized protein BU24DRAFT_50547 [Aaosphaeria arxii CBS 175.79]KAF2010992.1 hypothetical protein BU24DRAFT_50547 [Aaosphaeria arxii CBS 175.79]